MMTYMESNTHKSCICTNICQESHYVVCLALFRVKLSVIGSDATFIYANSEGSVFSKH